MKEKIFAGKWTARGWGWDAGSPELTFGSGHSAWFISKLDVLGAEGYLPVRKVEINRGLHPALCITVGRSSRRVLLCKQVRGGDGEVSSGHCFTSKSVEGAWILIFDILESSSCQWCCWWFCVQRHIWQIAANILLLRSRNSVLYSKFF